MRLYNSRTHQVEPLRPRRGRPLTVYVCGITPYDTTHLGHAFTYAVFDVLVRHLEVVHGRQVRYVQNVTDIDDDVLRRAAETSTEWQALGRSWTDRFRQDMAELNMRPPDVFPAATAFIAPMHEIIGHLVESGRAYARAGSVYFRVSADHEFGAMADMARAEMLATANERGNDPDDPNKDDALDFVLWQAARPGEPWWSSPWGPGRPGWHIECSAMARELLGDQVDIHGGGADLLFPHHCCEIAQCRPLEDLADPFVRFWAHVAMVRMDGEKMSKSLGNLVLVRDLLSDEHPDTIRLYLLRHHYRAAWEWNPERLAETTAWTRTLHAAAARAPGDGRPLDPAPYGPRFTAALDDDLGTPAALDVVLRLADDILAASRGTDLAPAQDILRTLAGRVLGLWLRPRKDLTIEPWAEPATAPPDGHAAAAPGPAS